MSRLFRNAARLNSTKFKFHIAFSPETIKLHPQHIGKDLTLVIRRGNKVYRTEGARKANDDWSDARIEFDCSLYRDKKGKYQEKLYLIQVLQYSPANTNSGKAPLFETKLDISTMVSVNESLEMTEIKSSKYAGAVLNIEVYCRFLKQQEGPGSEASTVMDNGSVMNGNNAMDSHISPSVMEIDQQRRRSNGSLRNMGGLGGLNVNSMDINNSRRGSNISANDEQDLGGFDIEANENLMKENEELKEKLKIIEKDFQVITEKEKAAFKFNSDLSKQRLKNLDLEQETLTLKKEIHGIKEQLTIKSKDYDEVIQQLQDMKTRKERDHNESVEKLQNMSTSLNECKEEILSMQKVLDEETKQHLLCQESLTTISSSLKGKDEKINELNMSLCEHRLQLEDVQGNNQSLLQNYNILEQQYKTKVEEYDEEVEKLQRITIAFSDIKDSKGNEFEEIRNHLEELKQVLAQEKQQHVECKESLGNLSLALRGKEEEVVALNGQITTNKSEIKKLQKKNMELFESCNIMEEKLQHKVKDHEELVTKMLSISNNSPSFSTFDVSSGIKDDEASTNASNEPRFESLLLLEKEKNRKEIESMQMILTSKNEELQESNVKWLSLTARMKQLEEELKTNRKTLKNTKEDYESSLAIIQEAKIEEIEKLTLSRKKEEERNKQETAVMLTKISTLESQVRDLEKEQVIEVDEIERMSLSLEKEKKENKQSTCEKLTNFSAMESQIKDLEKGLDMKVEEIERLTLSLEKGKEENKRVTDEMLTKISVMETQVNDLEKEHQMKVAQLSTNYEASLLTLKSETEVVENEKTKQILKLTTERDRLTILLEDNQEKKEEPESAPSTNLNYNEQLLKEQIDTLSVKIEDLEEELQTKKESWAGINDQLSKENDNHLRELTSAKITIAELQMQLDEGS